MVKKSNGLVISGIFFIMLFFISSCHKENTSFNYTRAVETVGDYVEAQQMSNLLLNTYFKSITDSVLLTEGFDTIDSANVSYTPNPATIIISYPWCIYDGYGHNRRGIIEATSSTGFFDSLDVINLTFKNFFYDNDSVTVGSLSITNKGLSTDHNYLFDIVASNIYRQTRDSLDNVTSMSYNMEQTFMLHKDMESPYYTQNDFFNISGNLWGNARNGYSFAGVISDTSMLKTSFSCNWLVSGITDIELPDYIYNAIVNFTVDGDCINMYSITTNKTLFTKAFDGDQAICGE